MSQSPRSVAARAKPRPRPRAVPVPSALASALAILGIGGLAFLVAPLVPMVNEVILALVAGVALANLLAGRWTISAAVSGVMLKQVLKLAVILLGAGIDVALLRSVGLPALSVIAVAVSVALAVSWLVGRAVRLGARSALLVGVGTAICGASAIAALAPVVKARQEEVGMSLATVLGFNALALVALPLIGMVAGLNPQVFGTWSGVAVHDTASAVATGFALGPESGQIATVVKLTRILFLIPIIGVVAAVTASRDASAAGGIRGAWRSIWGSVPWFVFGFVALALLNSLGWLGGTGELLSEGAKVLIVFVVAAIGLSLRLCDVARLGRRTLLTGFAASVTMAAVSLAVIATLHA